jgi:AcrR family transcriptional regulator
MSARRRRKPDAARQAILEAAERQLMAEGPESVRVQRIAAELGVSDAAIHYHFGSREALMASLLRWIGRRLVDDIEALVAAWRPGGVDVAALSRLFQRAYADERGARVAFWLTYSGWRSVGSGMLQPLVERVHQARVLAAERAGVPPPALADTQYAIALLSAAHLHSAAFGESLLASVTSEPEALSQTDFLAFVDDLIARRVAGV